VDTFLAIASKRDTRRYADRQVPEEIAASARNRQP